MPRFREKIRKRFVLLNQNSLDGICTSLTYALGIDAPECAAPRNEDLCE